MTAKISGELTICIPIGLAPLTSQSLPLHLWISKNTNIYHLLKYEWGLWYLPCVWDTLRIVRVHMENEGFLIWCLLLPHPQHPERNVRGVPLPHILSCQPLICMESLLQNFFLPRNLVTDWREGEGKEDYQAERSGLHRFRHHWVHQIPYSGMTSNLTMWNPFSLIP